MSKKWQFRLLSAFLVCVLALNIGQFAMPVSAMSEGNDQPPLIDRELFFGDPEISGSQISPNGKFISFRKQYNGIPNVWVKGIEQAFDAAKPLTADKRPVPAYFWSRDGKYILYVQDKGGDENFHVYAVDPTAKAEKESGVPPARDLTPIDGIRAFIYAVPRATPNEILIGLNDRDAAYHDLYRLNLTTGERKLIIENTEKVAGYNFDLKGNLRLATRQTDDAGFEILRIDGDKFTQIYKTTYEESATPTRFHKNGKWFYMNTNKGDDVDLTRLVLFNPETGEEKLVESDPEGEVDFGGAIFDSKTDELIATVYTGDRVRIYPKDKKFKDDLEILRKKLPEGDLNIQSSTDDMRFHIVVISRDVDPASVYLYDRKTEDVKLLYRSRPELKSDHLAHMRPVRYKARDGMEIPAYLSLPKGVEAKNLPVVINVHGGPWARDQWGYDSYTQFFANRGYAVLQPNFRGSTGFGKKFLNAGNNEWGTGDMQHDISDGVQYLINEGIADPKRVAIFGGSYGGYATLAGLAFTPELYAAGISYVGPSNLVTLLNSIPPYWGPIRKIFDKRLGDLENPEDKKRLMEQSPLFSADKIQAPLLVLQGANDPRVKQQESDQIVVALRERGLPVEYIVAGDEGHGFRAEDNRLASNASIEKFFATHIGGRYQEDMSDEIKEKLAALTVDINSVELPDNTMLSYAETAPLPQRSPENMRAAVMKYSASMQVGEQEMNMEIDREVAETELNGMKTWRVVSATQSPRGAAADTFYIDKETLLPVARRIKQGMASIKVDYHKDAIKGEIQAGPQQIPIDVKLAAPIMADGPAFEASIATLPLADGYKTTLRTFDILTQKVRPMSLKVTGKETVSVKAGSFETYIVEIEPLDGQPGGGRLNVCIDAPKCVVRNNAQLPAQMGGGKMLMELTSIGDMTAK